MLLDVKDLRVHYIKSEVLKGISFELAEGTIICVIGANGAGKTTILRTISGLKAPTSGEIWFQGQRIEGLAPQKRIQMGIAHVLEGRRIFPYMTVMQNLKMGAYSRKDRIEVNKDIGEMFEHFPILKERSKQMGGSLSGGEQQMLAVARALMSKPKVLLMDEPTMGLSPLMVKEVGQIIKNINQSGVSIILVEQNAHMALRLAHWGYVIETGSIVLQGDTKDIINNEQVKQVYLGG